MVCLLRDLMWSLGSHNLSTENSYVQLFLSLIDILSHSVPSSTWIFNPISVSGEGGFWIFTHDNSGPNVFFLNVLFCMLIWVLSWLLIAGVIQLREAHLHYSCRMIWQHLNIGLDTLLNCRCNLQGHYWALFDKERICKKTRVCWGRCKENSQLIPFALKRRKILMLWWESDA